MARGEFDVHATIVIDFKWTALLVPNHRKEVRGLVVVVWWCDGDSCGDGGGGGGGGGDGGGDGGGGGGGGNGGGGGGGGGDGDGRTIVGMACGLTYRTNQTRVYIFF